ncbi:Cof-type HAD-IIB family hydrolase [Pullulanibacillus camelliae]|nr:Cof-type HAD-IIB family hydrolase [Pullulanibacillus camelliae]
MYKIVFIDIDGTLVNEDKIVSNETKAAIKQLQQSRVEVVLSTGRPPYHFSALARELGIHSYVSFNGAYVCYRGKGVKSFTMNKVYIQRLVELSSEHGHPLVFLDNEKAVCNEENHPHIIQSFNDLKLAYAPKCNPDFWRETELFQMMLYCQKHEERLYHEQMSELSLVRWHEYALDVMPAHVSKAVGIHYLLHYLDISPDAAVAIGDGLNDKEMLAYVGMGVAMGNAHPDLMEHANMITKDVNHDGVSFALKKLRLIT